MARHLLLKTSDGGTAEVTIVEERQHPTGADYPKFKNGHRAVDADGGEWLHHWESFNPEVPGWWGPDGASARLLDAWNDGDLRPEDLLKVDRDEFVRRYNETHGRNPSFNYGMTEGTREDYFMLREIHKSTDPAAVTEAEESLRRAQEHLDSTRRSYDRSRYVLGQIDRF